MGVPEFPIKVGEKLLRASLHELIGGTPQSGMTSCLNGDAFLLFHNPKISRKFGYDFWEGLQADGTFWYTGQGKYGDQTLTRSNLKLIEAFESGKSIHLFLSESRFTIYQGEVKLNLERYEWKFAPDLNKSIRKVIVFKLVPLLGNLLLREQRGIDPIISVELVEIPEVIPPNQRKGRNKDLKSLFCEFIGREGRKIHVQRLKLPNRKGYISLDFCDVDSKVLYQVIDSVNFDNISQAIGRILMYRSLLDLVHQNFIYKIVVPQVPNSRIVQLCKDLGIELLELPSEFLN